MITAPEIPKGKDGFLRAFAEKLDTHQCVPSCGPLIRIFYFIYPSSLTERVDT